MEAKTAVLRFALSIYVPIDGAKAIAAVDLMIAYIETSRRPPGKSLAMNRIAPNSKMREFKVDRRWDAYRALKGTAARPLEVSGDSSSRVCTGGGSKLSASTSWTYW